MISHGEGFVIRHRSGRYFNSDCYSPGFPAGGYDPSVGVSFIYRLVDSPFHADLVYRRDAAGRFLDDPEWSPVADQFEVVPGPGCAVCGERGGTIWGREGSYRCDRHKDRNPCAIEGCKRTREAGSAGLASDQYLCGEHWRKYVPPRSRLRRLYHAHFRRGKHEGGFLDEAEINRIMGWD